MAFLARLLDFGTDKISPRKSGFFSQSFNAPMSDIKPSSVPEGQCVYAVGDVHGKLELLDKIMLRIKDDAIAYLGDKKTLVFLGDYIDRGNNSRGVIDYLLSKLPEGFETVFLRGNHEDHALKFLQGNMEAGRSWLQFGGVATVASYGVNPYRQGSEHTIEQLQTEFATSIPAAHRAFLENTRFSHSLGDYYFVHAGVRPRIGLDDQDDYDKLWIRDEFLGSQNDFGKIVVHGHSIAPEPDVQINRIGIDTGAYATGKLTALRLTGADRHFLHT